MFSVRGALISALVLSAHTGFAAGGAPQGANSASLLAVRQAVRAMGLPEAGRAKAQRALLRQATALSASKHKLSLWSDSGSTAAREETNPYAARRLHVFDAGGHPAASAQTTWRDRFNHREENTLVYPENGQTVQMNSRRLTVGPRSTLRAHAAPGTEVVVTTKYVAGQLVEKSLASARSPGRTLSLLPHPVANPVAAASSAR